MQKKKITKPKFDSKEEDPGTRKMIDAIKNASGYIYIADKIDGHLEIEGVDFPIPFETLKEYYKKRKDKNIDPEVVAAYKYLKRQCDSCSRCFINKRTDYIKTKKELKYILPCTCTLCSRCLDDIAENLFDYMYESETQAGQKKLHENLPRCQKHNMPFYLDSFPSLVSKGKLKKNVEAYLNEISKNKEFFKEAAEGKIYKNHISRYDTCACGICKKKDRLSVNTLMFNTAYSFTICQNCYQKYVDNLYETWKRRKEMKKEISEDDLYIERNSELMMPMMEYILPDFYFLECNRSGYSRNIEKKLYKEVKDIDKANDLITMFGKYIELINKKD